MDFRLAIKESIVIIGQNEVCSMNTEELQASYKHPPITERVLVAFANIQSETFEQRREAFQLRLMEKYPIVERKTTICVGINFGVPAKNNLSAPESKPELKLTHMFWREAEKRCGVRFFNNALVINLISKNGHPGSFKEILLEFLEVFEIWKSVFDIKRITALTVEYVNTLSKTIWDRTKTKDPKELLTIFPQIPGKNTLVPPCNINFNIRSMPNLTLMVGVNIAQDLSLQQIFSGRMLLNDNLDQDVNHLFTQVHDIILEKFELYYTQQAKDIFNSLANE